MPDGYYLFFFFNDTATTEIYTLSLHDALPICRNGRVESMAAANRSAAMQAEAIARGAEQYVLAMIASEGQNALRSESTRLNSSHANISYAVFCLKKKKYTKII